MSAASANPSHLAAAWALYQTRRYADALKHVEQALAAEPQDLEAHRLRALALMMLDRHSDALRAVRHAILLDPLSEWSHRIDAIVLLESGQLAAARKSIDEAIRLLPRSVDAWSIVAEIELRRGNAEKAYEAAQAAMKLDPLHRPTFVRAAHAAARTGRLEPAKEYARRAVALDPLSASAHRALGVASFAAGDRAAARAAFREAIRLDPTDESSRTEFLQTLRARSPVYRVMVAVMTWFRGAGRIITRGVVVVGWLTARALAVSGVSEGRDAAMVAIAGAVLLLPVVLVPLHDLIVWHDPFGRLLLHLNEKIAAATTSLLLLAAALLSGARFAFHSDLCGWTAAGIYAIGAYVSLLRRVRTRWALVWVAGVAALLVVEVAGAIRMSLRRDADSVHAIVAAFVVTLLIGFLSRKSLAEAARKKR